MSLSPDNSADPAEGRVSDATDLNWVDRHAPPWSRPYLRLSRADRPIGTWLLLIPSWWGIALGAVRDGWTLWDLWLAVGCAIGAFLMRGAGCTWNDLSDRDIDAQVTRTRSRPLPSGQISPRAAFAWMIVQALISFCILLTFDMAGIVLGVIALAPVAVYPFAKRFTWWPQVFLGIAFNWGVLLLWAAKTGGMAMAPVYLYAAGIAWTLLYDTIYAHQDREDDALIGVKSTARLFGADTARMLWLFALCAGLLGAVAIVMAGGGWIALTGLAAFVGHLVWQTLRVDIDDPQTCLRLFRANREAGLLLLAGLILDATF